MKKSKHLRGLLFCTAPLMLAGMAQAFNQMPLSDADDALGKRFLECGVVTVQVTPEGSNEYKQGMMMFAFATFLRGDRTREFYQSEINAIRTALHSELAPLHADRKVERMREKYVDCLLFYVHEGPAVYKRFEVERAVTKEPSAAAPAQTPTAPAPVPVPVPDKPMHADRESTMPASP